jgi:hypothetical protein
MAAFLKVDILRAHAASVCLPDAFGLTREPLWPRPEQRRAVLTAQWLVAPGGRLACRWQTSVSAPFGPPPS